MIIKKTSTLSIKAFVLMLISFSLLPFSLYSNVDTLEIYSESMDRTIPAAVLLPDCYHESDGHYPVVYLLHGATGNFSNWLDRFPEPEFLHRIANLYKVIFAMPDGDPFGFYFDSPWNPQSQFETHIAKEHYLIKCSSLAIFLMLTKLNF